MAEWTDKQKEKIIARLGELPEKPQDYPLLYCEVEGIHVDLGMNVVEAGEDSQDIDAVDEPSEGYDDSDDVHDPKELTKHIGRPTVMSLRRDLRLCNAELNMGYQVGVMNDALDHYLERRCTDRVAEIYATIAYDSVAARMEFVNEQWFNLVDAVFDEPKLSTSAQIAVLKGTIWQAKRKMIHRKVQQHYMPVLIGRTNSGKSRMMEAFTRPLQDAHKLNVNFEMLLDQRYINLWRYNFIMLLDEMQKAASSDRDAIKAMITAPYLVRRPMRTNFDINVAHNSTFLGASNRPFPDLVKDPTGIRRFIPCQTRRLMDWDVVNETEYVQLWQSVNEFDPINPAMEYWQDEIAPLQEDNRVRTTVEEWAFLISEDAVAQAEWAEWHEDKEAFDSFHDWESSNYPKQEKTYRRLFYQEMNDLADAGTGWEHSNREGYRFNKKEG